MAASASPGETAAPCDDFMAFQEVLRKLRRVDDNIISSLNTTLPTESFSAECDPPALCKKLYEQLLAAYAQRDKAIKGCLQQSKEKLDHLQELRAAKGDDPTTLRQLRKEQSQIRLLRNELNVEEVVKDRSLKVFHERCRLFYSPPQV
uniref:Protein MIX23 n=1 Tax=Amblyomma parvum TaxID=251391 RepID=A0A023FTD7_AMBPA